MPANHLERCITTSSHAHDFNNSAVCESDLPFVSEEFLHYVFALGALQQIKSLSNEVERLESMVEKTDSVISTEKVQQTTTLELKQLPEHLRYPVDWLRRHRPGNGLAISYGVRAHR